MLLCLIDVLNKIIFLCVFLWIIETFDQFKTIQILLGEFELGECELGEVLLGESEL